MKIENQVCSLELSKQLKEAGVKQESVFYWAWYKQRHDPLWEVVNRRTDEAEYSAFTVSELGEMLPDRTPNQDKETKGLYPYNFVKWPMPDPMHRWRTNLWTATGHTIWASEQFADTEADARGLMLKYLIQNGLLNIK